jgi:rusticyanin
MTAKRISVLIGTAVAVAGLGAATAITACGTSAPPSASKAATTSPSESGYSWYQSMMNRYYGGSTMMGGTGGYGWMMGSAGYRWMMGGLSAPAWMRGAHLPSAMMGTAGDMGQAMGRLWASAPGPRVTPEQAVRDGGQVPAGAKINAAANTITFTTGAVSLAAVASPTGGPDETFRIAGLVNPKIIVPSGARVRIQVINADPDTAHGLVITASGSPSAMPMMTSRTAFTGSALWFLGNPTSAGMHTGTFTFTATTPGSYQYLCPVPGHAQKGMAGSFIVARSS